MIAVRFGVKVVSDFRRRDVACGGEGAPLVPVFHRCMMNKRDKPVAVLNIGGVANITYIGFRETLIAFDTGPGNALINDATLEHYALPYDESGNIAAQGNPDHLAVDHILEDAFFKRPPPKSLDRNYFYKYLYLLDQTNPQDKIATLTNLTARSIIRSISSLPQIPKEILVCGGGVKNLTLMNQLNIGGLGAIFKPLGINKNNGESCDTDFIESRAFAYLAVRLIYDMDSTFSSTTGTSIPKSAGVVYDL
jgi:anhydro-N-acetylmuramic acid kinase